MKFRFIYLTYFVLLSATSAIGQPPDPIAESESDGRYGELTGIYGALSARKDSMDAKMESIRRLFAADAPDKEKYSEELILLEIDSYNIRDSLAAVARHINAIEQERNISKLQSGGHNDTIPAHIPDAEVIDLVRNRFFKETLPPEEYRQLLHSQEAERETERLIAAIQVNHSRMAALDTLYRKAGSEQADSLYLIFSGMAAENDTLHRRMRKVWDEVFDSKVYLYNYIHYKVYLGVTTAYMERLMTEVNLRSAETRGRYMYDAVAAYPFQKALLLRYETIIATKAGLTLAADSLKDAALRVAVLNNYLLPVIDTEERLFLDYSDIAVSKPPIYNSGNPIPSTITYRKGSIYRILLGVYSSPQSAAPFKGVHPLSYEQKDDGKYYYYAGGFPSYEETEIAAAQLKKVGFKNPRTVAWHDGVYYNVGEGAKNPPSRREQIEAKYRVEITGTAESLSEQVRAVIVEVAPGKEISKVVGGEGASYVFIISSFDNPATARALAAAVTTIDPTLAAEVINLPASDN